MWYIISYLSVKPKLLQYSWTVAGSQDNIHEESHDYSAYEPRDRNCHKPGDEDVPEQTPVN